MHTCTHTHTLTHTHEQMQSNVQYTCGRLYHTSLVAAGRAAAAGCCKPVGLWPLGEVRTQTPRLRSSLDACMCKDIARLESIAMMLMLNLLLSLPVHRRSLSPNPRAGTDRHSGFTPSHLSRLSFSFPLSFSSSSSSTPPLLLLVLLVLLPLLLLFHFLFLFLFLSLFLLALRLVVLFLVAVAPPSSVGR
eukprot:GHVU01145182.1.p1 GENE.GHVU01145182.1~~GHVU01145182.1.p1  ORF type:complete len:190 (-),score=17.77 GHVU01145182.1:97-666(-)